MNKNIEKQMTHAREHLEEGESPVEIVFGAYETKVLGSDSVREGVFIATDRRLVFFGKKMFGFDLESFPYSSISSIEFSKGFMGHTISFFASGNNVKMKWIKTDNIAAFVGHIRSNMGKKENSGALSSAQPIDPIEQIRKLAELKDSGLITEQEFTSKKQEMLSRM